ncbi:MAG: DNA-binding protein [Mycobacteriaceae bacterium]|nr:DNA-binding protein [Mycobacteriaceae bacterium]
MTDARIPAGGLAEWLAGRSDDELVELLRRRPDLTVPLPPSMSVLAQRMEQRASLARAADEFDTFTFAVIDTMLAELDDLVFGNGRDGALSRTQVHKFVADRAGKATVDRAAVDAALDELLASGVAWGDDAALRLTTGAESVLPWPAGSLAADDALPEDTLAAALAAIGEPERQLLERLAHTAPIGRTRDAAPDTPPDRPVPKLLAAGLLRKLDDQTVELPAQVARMVRGLPPVHAALAPPGLPTVERPTRDIDGAAAGEVLELLRQCTDVLHVLGETPAPVLKTGGMGVRELRRVAKQAGIDEARLGLLVEILAAANLLGRGTPDPLPDTVDLHDDYWAPTVAVDGWLDAPTAHQWHVLAKAWLEMARLAWLIGMRDRSEKPVAALSDELYSPTVAANRRIVLEQLAALAPGHTAAPADVIAALSWQRPRWSGRLRGNMVERILDEAAALGVTGRGGLSSPGRALLAGESDAAEKAMAKALPTPVDYVLVQADLTVVAPGPLTPELKHRVEQVADLESAGGATVYRIGETTVRRALDGGVTAAALHELFATHSTTPVPQALTYLIDDVARRHGRLRAGVARSFLRCDDPAQLAEVLKSPAAADLALRAIAPTVAISQAPLSEVLDTLRGAGFTPAGEDSGGHIVDLHARGARIITRRSPRGGAPRLPGIASPEQLRHLVAELRANDRAGRTQGGNVIRADGSKVTGAAIVALLQLAARGRRQVTLTYVDAQGVASQRVVDPVRVAAGQLDAFDSATGSLRYFSLHRIVSVNIVE